jgi:hypothetical protein
MELYQITALLRISTEEAISALWSKVRPNFTTSEFLGKKNNLVMITNGSKMEDIMVVMANYKLLHFTT